MPGPSFDSDLPTLVMGLLAFSCCFITLLAAIAWSCKQTCAPEPRATRHGPPIEGGLGGARRHGGCGGRGGSRDVDTMVAMEAGQYAATIAAGGQQCRESGDGGGRGYDLGTCGCGSDSGYGGGGWGGYSGGGNGSYSGGGGGDSGGSGGGGSCD